MFKRLLVSTLNCQGLNKLDKLLLIKDILKKHHIDICFLQETHIDCEKQRSNLSLYLKEYFVFCEVTENKTKGVAIIVKKSLNCKFENIHHYNDRCMSLDIKLNSRIFNLINIYVPNTPEEQIKFIEELTPILSKKKNVILGGDFNFVEDNSLDRDNIRARVRNEVCRHQKTWIRFFKVIRFREGTLDREKFGNLVMTWSNGIQSSRLDRFYYRKDVDYTISYSKFSYFPMSDHCMVIANLDLKEQFSNKTCFKKDNNWKLNETILDDESVDEGIILLCKRIPYFKLKNSLNWYEYFISEVIKFLKQKSRQINKLKTDKVNFLFEKMDLFKANHDLMNLHMIKNEINDHYKELRNGLEIRACEIKRNFIKQPSKVLIEKEKSLITCNEISKYKTKDNFQTENLEDILKDIELFYKSLMGYERVKQSDLNEHKFKIEPLSPLDRRKINSRITLLEAEKAIREMKGAAPGSNGLTIGFFKKYFHLFGKDFVEVLNNLDNPLTNTFNEVKIKLIPKNKNDIKTVDDLRPISLTNYEYRIFTKILTDRLSGIAHNVIGEHQTCSIIGRRMSDNIILTRDLIYYTNLLKKKLNIISIDQRKAFDSISHKYLFELLEHLGIGEFMLLNIKRLYEKSYARIIVNQHMSNQFDIKSGIKQGCSLSMLLYVFAIEELLLSINLNKGIKGVRLNITKQIEIKSSAYADDVVGYVADNDSIEVYFNEFYKWGKVSGASINNKKTKIVSINSCYLSDTYSVVDTVKILGIIFDSKGISNTNFIHMIDKLRASVFIWNSTNISLIERVVACKTFLLSKLWFVASFLNFTKKNIKYINSILFGFIWNNKSELIKRNTLILPYNEGGIEIFNVNAKLQTIALQQMIRIARYHGKISFQLSIYFLKFKLKNIKLKNFNIIPSCEDKERPIIYEKMVESLVKFTSFDQEKDFNLLNTKYSSKGLYIRFRKEYEIKPEHQNINIEWKDVYKRLNNNSLDARLREINYRVMFNGLCLGFKFKGKLNNKCYFCKLYNEDQDHILINCKQTNVFFNSINSNFKDKSIKLTKLKVFYSDMMNKEDTKKMSIFKLTIWQLRNMLRKRIDFDKAITFQRLFTNNLISFN